ncbi:MAG TPA: OsmC family protein [Nitrospira sp.]|nr:OsmC family protein [Nitrospira sp.]
MKLSVAYQGGKRHDIVSERHRVVTDQPVEDGGQDAGLSPVELFVGSLAGCVGYFVGRFCERHDIPHQGLHVEAEWEMAENPHRVGRIALSIHLSSPLTAVLRERLLKVAHGCTVHQSLTTAPTVDITFTPQNTSMAHQS